MNKSIIQKTSYEIKSGNVEAAEALLVAVAETEGDKALQIVLEEIPPKDLLAIMRNYDGSNESVINLLVSPEQFARAVVNEKLYKDQSNSKLRGMINAVFFREGVEPIDYIDALSTTEGATEVFINYLADHMEDVCYFSRFTTFSRHNNFEENPNEWILDENYNWYDSQPSNLDVSLAEVSDHSWKEITWILLHHYPNLFNEIIPELRVKILNYLSWADRQKAESYEELLSSDSNNEISHDKKEEELNDDDYDEDNNNAL